MKVVDLINLLTCLWVVVKVHQFFAVEDVPRIMTTKINPLREDSVFWSFSKDGSYSSKSSYSFLDVLQNMQSGSPHGTPPIEKALWNKVWKVKTSPKLKHFLWRALSRALVVKEILQSRGILVNPSCNAYNMMALETICHVLFTCTTAKKLGSYPTFPFCHLVSLPIRSF